MANVHVENVTRTHGPHFTLPSSATPAASGGVNLRSLPGQLEEIVQVCAEKGQAVRSHLQLAFELTNAKDVAYTSRTANQQRDAVVLQGNSRFFRDQDRQELLAHWSTEACVTNEVQLNRFADASETVISLPVYVNSKPVDALHAALLVPRAQIEPFIVTLQLIATSLGKWHATYAAKDNQFEATSASAVIELLSKSNAASSLNEAAFVIANEMQKFLGCQSVAVALCDRSGKRARVKAISGGGVLDQNTDLVKRITDLANESLDREKQTIWPPLSATDRMASRVHQQFVENSQYEAVVSGPLENDDEVLGSWVFLGSREILHDSLKRGVIEAATPHVASALALQKEAQAGPLQRTRRFVKGTPEVRRTRRAIFVGLLLGALALAIPVPHKISCDCTVKPTIRRFASVPFSGILRDSLVQPGDLVQAGDVLARMDDRDLRFEKSESIAERTKSRKEFDVELSKQRIAAAQIADLKSKELDARLDWIRHREENLDIRSPISGVVLKGDLEDAQGAPVQIGQVLFEVAPLDTLELKLAIPEEDVCYADEAMEVVARLDGAPGERLQATLDRISPRATAETGQNVFMADGVLGEVKHVLRPGMSGTAKIIGSKRALGWILFHKAYQQLSNVFEW